MRELNPQSNGTRIAISGGDLPVDVRVFGRQPEGRSTCMCLKETYSKTALLVGFYGDNQRLEYGSSHKNF